MTLHKSAAAAVISLGMLTSDHAASENRFDQAQDINDIQDMVDQARAQGLLNEVNRGTEIQITVPERTIVVPQPTRAETATTSVGDIPDIKDILNRENGAGEALARRLRTGGQLDENWHQTMAIDRAETERLLKELQPQTWADIEARRSAVIDLDKLPNQFNVPAEIQAKGLKTYAIYDSSGSFITLVFVPWNKNIRDWLAAATVSFGNDVEPVRVWLKKAGEYILGIEEKIIAALENAKEWACSIRPQPEQVSVTVEGQFSLYMVAFGGSAGATYTTKTLCDAERIEIEPVE